MEKQRATALLAESADEAVKLSERIAIARRRLETSQDRVKAFQAAARQASTDQREQQKSAALAAWERKFANKVTAGARLDKAIAELSAAVAQYHTVSAELLPWPADLFPPTNIFQHYHGSSDQYALEKIASALGMCGSETYRMLTELPAKLSVADYDRAYGPWLIDQLREAPLPELIADEEAA